MKNIRKVILSKIRILIGLRYDKSVIPEGLFCYKYDAKKTEALIDEWDNGFYVKICPYHLNVSNNYCCCLYKGKISKDKKFKEKNKICNINKKY